MQPDLKGSMVSYEFVQKHNLFRRKKTKQEPNHVGSVLNLTVNGAKADLTKCINKMYKFLLITIRHHAE